MRLTFVRHAQSIWNAEDRWQGQSDVPLSDRGRDEARIVGERLGGEAFDRIVSSDLSRALETARAIAGERPIETRAALREMNLGSWCGRPHDEVKAQYPDELRALQRGEPMRIGGTGETIVEFGDRVLAELSALESEAAPGQHLLVVTHGGVIRAVMMALLDLAGRERPLIGVGNTGIVRMVIEDGRRALVAYNDQHHLGLCHEDGDRLLRGETAHGELCTALGLTAPPLGPLGDGMCIVARPGEGGRLQLRRYGVPAPAERASHGG
jgi:broad specificity phosphatase PhoE